MPADSDAALAAAARLPAAPSARMRPTRLRMPAPVVSLAARRLLTRYSSTTLGTPLYETVGTPDRAASAVIVPPDPTNTSQLSSRYLPSYDMPMTVTARPNSDLMRRVCSAYRDSTSMFSDGNAPARALITPSATFEPSVYDACVSVGLTSMVLFDGSAGRRPRGLAGLLLAVMAPSIDMYWTTRAAGMPCRAMDAFETIHGTSSLWTSGAASLSTLCECGASMNAMWSAPRPRATSAASGEQKLTTRSGSRLEATGSSPAARRTLAASLPALVPPPCLPTWTMERPRTLASSDDSLYERDVQTTLWPLLLSLPTMGSKNTTCLGVRMSNHILNGPHRGRRPLTLSGAAPREIKPGCLARPKEARGESYRASRGPGPDHSRRGAPSPPRRAALPDRSERRSGAAPRRAALPSPPPAPRRPPTKGNMRRAARAARLMSNARLATIGGFELRLHHLLVAGVLASAFTVSFLIRAQPAEFGYELNEFDPFFNYRATEYLVENGPQAYADWHDAMSWFPNGRDVSATSQTMLHVTAAYAYSAFGGGSSLYDFTILMPAVFGSLTAVVVFALVRVIGGTTAGLFASMLFAVSVPVIVRGTIGWFKSEPLGLFYGLLGMYLFLSALRGGDGGGTARGRAVAGARMAGGGITLAFGLASWGGIQYMVVPLCLFLLVLPLLRRDHSFLAWSVPAFAAAFLVTVPLFERPGLGFVTGIGGVLVAGSAAYLAASSLLQRFSPRAAALRNGLLFLGGTVAAGAAVLAANASSGFIPLPSFRYQNALNPFLRSVDPLVDSVAEHATTTTAQSFFFLSILIVFAGAGAWLAFSNRDRLRSYRIHLRPEMAAFALVFGAAGAYVSSAFIRLELFASLAVIVLASMGLAVLASEALRPDVQTKRHVRGMPLAGKAAFVSVIVGLLLVPTVVPIQGNWVDSVRAPPTLLNGGTNFGAVFPDWPDALEWLRTQTPEGSVVAAWWDYGYWITTMGNRTSLADNATVDSAAIREIARTMLADPDEAWRRLAGMQADYVLLFVAGTKIQSEPVGAYLLNGGGDESKKQWFMRIAADDPVEKYLHADGLSGTDHFWGSTLAGRLIPYSVLAYVNPATNEQSASYLPGYTPVYALDLKYPPDGDGPFRLAYASGTFWREAPGPVTAVLIYEVNKGYDPDMPTAEEALEAIMEQQRAALGTAVVSTAAGEFTIGLRPDLAPRTVENFQGLARAGFYDGTIFHRINPGFVLQGGDPNTREGPRETWGAGGPGYTVPAEISGATHSKYAVSMARGADIDSAGSQFFVVLGDAPWLDGQYTVFGEVTEGRDVVDRLAAVGLEGGRFPEQPGNPDETRILAVAAP